jgi:hypothetical protein
MSPGGMIFFPRECFVVWLKDLPLPPVTANDSPWERVYEKKPGGGFETTEGE